VTLRLVVAVQINFHMSQDARGIVHWNTGKRPFVAGSSGSRRVCGRQNGGRARQRLCPANSGQSPRDSGFPFPVVQPKERAEVGDLIPYNLTARLQRMRLDAMHLHQAQLLRSAA